jgi:hypothetical protein
LIKDLTGGFPSRPAAITTPHKQAGHMKATDQNRPDKKPLPQGRPHMNQNINPKGIPLDSPQRHPALSHSALSRVASQLADELGKAFADAKAGEPIQGRLVRAVEVHGGRHALIERSRDFTLVSWRPVPERHVGKNVSGIMRDSGINWTFGRQRDGPTIS